MSKMWGGSVKSSRKKIKQDHIKKENKNKKYFYKFAK